MKVPGVSQPHQRLVVLEFFYFSHSNRCIVLFYCSFNFYFPNGDNGEHFLRAVCHLYIIIVEIS